MNESTKIRLIDAIIGKGPESGFDHETLDLLNIDELTKIYAKIARSGDDSIGWEALPLRGDFAPLLGVNTGWMDDTGAWIYCGDLVDYTQEKPVYYYEKREDGWGRTVYPRFQSDTPEKTQTNRGIVIYDRSHAQFSVVFEAALMDSDKQDLPLFAVTQYIGGKVSRIRVVTGQVRKEKQK